MTKTTNMRGRTAADRFSLRRPGLLACAVALLLISACGGGGDAPPPGDAPLACVNVADEVSWFSGPASNDWNDVLIDRQQRIWLAGYAGGILGQTNIEPTGDSRAVLRQLASDGRLLWDSAARLDTPGTDVAEALALGPTGTLFVAGRTSGAFGTAVNAGQFDTFVAWSDAPGGDAAWRLFQTGTERPQHPRRLAIGADGELHIAGFDDDYVPSNFLAAWSDPFAQRLRRVGAGTADDRLEQRWHHQFASAVADHADGLAVTPVAGGATYVGGGVAAGTQRGMFVRKLAADGQVVWTARYSINPLDHIAALVALPDGSLLIAGSVVGSFQGAPALGQQDAFVARIAADDGRVLARWQYGSAESEWVTDMKLDSAGNIVLFGETLGAVAPGSVPAGSSDLFLLKIAPDGQLLAARQWGTPADEAARRVAIDACGHVVAVGGSTTAGRRSGVMWFWRP